MNIILALLLGAICGIGLGLWLSVILERDDDTLATAYAEIYELREQVGALMDQNALLGTTLDATRDRERALEELSREMNQ